MEKKNCVGCRSKGLPCVVCSRNYKDFFDAQPTKPQLPGHVVSNPKDADDPQWDVLGYHADRINKLIDYAADLSRRIEELEELQKRITGELSQRICNLEARK